MNKWVPTAGILAVVAAMELLAPAAAQAQIRFGVGVGVGSGRGFYYGSYPYGFSPGYTGYTPGYNYRYYPSYTRYVPYSYGYAYPYGGYYSSYYASNPWLRYDALRSSYLSGGGDLPPYPLYPVSPANLVTPVSPPPAVPAAPSVTTTRVDVRVAAAATVWFNDRQTSQTGPIRYFVTPALTPGKSYSYDVQARWMANGREVTQTRTLTFVAGGPSPLLVDFTAPDRNPAASSPGDARP